MKAQWNNFYRKKTGRCRITQKSLEIIMSEKTSKMKAFLRQWFWKSMKIGTYQKKKKELEENLSRNVELIYNRPHRRKEDEILHNGGATGPI